MKETVQEHIIKIFIRNIISQTEATKQVNKTVVYKFVTHINKIKFTCARVR